MGRKQRRIATLFTEVTSAQLLHSRVPLCCMHASELVYVLDGHAPVVCGHERPDGRISAGLPCPRQRLLLLLIPRTTSTRASDSQQSSSSFVSSAHSSQHHRRPLRSSSLLWRRPLSRRRSFARRRPSHTAFRILLLEMPSAASVPGIAGRQTQQHLTSSSSSNRVTSTAANACPMLAA